MKSGWSRMRINEKGKEREREMTEKNKTTITTTKKR